MGCSAGCRVEPEASGKFTRAVERRFLNAARAAAARSPIVNQKQVHLPRRWTFLPAGRADAILRIRGRPRDNRLDRHVQGRPETLLEIAFTPRRRLGRIRRQAEK